MGLLRRNESEGKTSSVFQAERALPRGVKPGAGMGRVLGCAWRSTQFRISVGNAITTPGLIPLGRCTGRPKNLSQRWTVRTLLPR